MIEARTIFQQTRPTAWPAPTGTSVTVMAKTYGDVISLFWERDDLVAKGVPGTQLTLNMAEFRAIVAAVNTQTSHRGFGNEK